MISPLKSDMMCKSQPVWGLQPDFSTDSQDQVVLQETWQLHVVWTKERESEKATEVRDKPWIVLTSKKGSGRATSSLCNARHHGRERRSEVHTMETGWAEGRQETLMEGGCKGCVWLDKSDWSFIGWVLWTSEILEADGKFLFDFKNCVFCVVWENPLSHHRLDDFFICFW